MSDNKMILVPEWMISHMLCDNPERIEYIYNPSQELIITSLSLGSCGRGGSYDREKYFSLLTEENKLKLIIDNLEYLEFLPKIEKHHIDYLMEHPIKNTYYYRDLPESIIDHRVQIIIANNNVFSLGRRDMKLFKETEDYIQNNCIDQFIEVSEKIKNDPNVLNRSSNSYLHINTCLSLCL